MDEVQWWRFRLPLIYYSYCLHYSWISGSFSTCFTLKKTLIPLHSKRRCGPQSVFDTVVLEIMHHQPNEKPNYAVYAQKSQSRKVILRSGLSTGRASFDWSRYTLVRGWFTHLLFCYGLGNLVRIEINLAQLYCCVSSRKKTESTSFVFWFATYQEQKIMNQGDAIKPCNVVWTRESWSREGTGVIAKSGTRVLLFPFRSGQ